MTGFIYWLTLLMLKDKNWQCDIKLKAYFLEN